MNTTLELKVTLTSIDCGGCGGRYAINERYRNQCQKDGRSWHCPYCQIGWGFEENENDRLRKELHAAELEKTRLTQQAEAAVKERDRAWSTLVSTEKKLKATAKRAAAGVCPCCTRSFVQLRRHMATKHPEYQV